MRSHSRPAGTSTEETPEPKMSAHKLLQKQMKQEMLEGVTYYVLATVVVFVTMMYLKLA
jgi:hypothetical protein